MSRDHEKTARDLLRQLGAGAVVPGEWSGRLELAGHFVEIQVRVRRKPGYEEAGELQRQALELLEKRYESTCYCVLARKSVWCSKPITHVFVTRTSFRRPEDPEHQFRFTCATHAQQRETDPSAVAVLELPKRPLAEIRQKRERAEAERRRREAELEQGVRGLVAFLRAVRGDDNELARRRAQSGGRQ